MLRGGEGALLAELGEAGLQPAERRDENTQQTDELKRKEQNFSNRYSKLRKDFIESDR